MSDIFENKGALAATIVVAASDSLNQAAGNYVCDGTADELEIQTAVNALPAGGGKVELLEGTYNLTAAIATISGLTIEGYRATLVWDSTQNYNALELISKTDVHIKGLTIDGTSPGAHAETGADHYGIFIESSNRVTVEDVYIKDVYDVGFKISCGVETESIINIDRVIVDNCEKGMYVWNWAGAPFYHQQIHRQIILDNLTIIDPASYPMDITINGLEINNLVIKGTAGHIIADIVENMVVNNCFIDGCGGFWITAGVANAHSKHIKITNLIVRDAIFAVGIGSDADLAGSEIHDIDIVNATCYSSSSNGFGVGSTATPALIRDVKFTNCRAYEADWAGFAFTRGTREIKGIELANCEAVGCGFEGIDGGRVNHVKVIGGIYKNNGQAGARQVGINLDECFYWTVIGVQATDDQDTGITSLLTADAASGQPDVTVANGALFWVGQAVTISDLTPDTENNRIASIAGNVLTMENNLANDYTVAQTAKVDGRKTQLYAVEEFNGSDYNTYKANNFLGNGTDAFTALAAIHNQYDHYIKSTVALNLTGGATDIEIFYANRPCWLISYFILYSVATGGGAGVDIRVGRYQDGVVLDDDYYAKSTSELNKSKGYAAYRYGGHLTQHMVEAGDTITVGTAGGKADTGEIIIILQIAEMAD